MQIHNTTGGVTHSNSTVLSVAPSNDDSSVASSYRSTAKQLNDWLHETPEQRMEDSILASMGLTREQYEHMSGPEKEKVAEKIRETLKEKIRAQVEQANAHANIKGASAAAAAAQLSTSL
ncbi:hypothetical protein ACW910_29345 (plasmid) [Burkholderia ambifaria]